MHIGSMTPAEVQKILVSKGVSPETSKELKNIVERLQVAIYSGKGADTLNIVKKIPSIIKQIEKEIR